jgi:hypothetical protein
LKIKLPWFKFFATDWISDPQVSSMSARQVGWYIRLLAYCWQEGGLPDWDLDGDRIGDRDDQFHRILAQVGRDIDFIEEIVSGVETKLTGYKDVEVEWRLVLSLFSLKSPDGKRFHPKLYGQYLEAIEINNKRVKAAQKTNAKRSGDRDGDRALRASESISGSPSLVLSKDNFLMKRTLEVVDEHTERFEAFMGVFVLAGVAMNEQDKMRCAQMWVMLDEATEIQILDDVKRKATDGTWPTASKTRRPWNYLEGKEWTRVAIPRILPNGSKSKAEEAHERATQRFMEAK